MLIFNIKYKNTILLTSVKIQMQKRNYPGGNKESNIAIVIRTSNAFIEYHRTQDDTFVPEVQQITEYLFSGLENQKTFSEMAGESSQILGYHIHADSFVAFIEGTRGMITRKMGIKGIQDFDNGLIDMDDLQLYQNNQGKLELNANYKEVYDGYLDAIYYDNLNINNNTTRSNSEYDSSSTEFSDNESVPEGYTAEYYHIPVAANSDTSSQNSLNSQSSFEGAVNPPNNLNHIVLLTLAAFIVIQGLVVFNIWYKGKNNTPGDTEVCNTDNHDTELHSVHEFLYTFSFIIQKLLFCLIPSFILILYLFRYYYLYKFLLKKCS